MKQIYKLALILGILPSAVSAQYSQSFDSSTVPSDWTIINGGDTEAWQTWTSYDSTFNASHSGTHFLGLKYGSTTHSDYAISPAIVVTAGVSDKLTFWARNRGAGLIEQFDVKVSTTTPTAAGLTNTVVAALKPPISWTQYTYDLSAYIGQTIYIGFYSSTTNVWFVGIDDFQVFGTALSVSDVDKKNAKIYPNPVEDVLHIESKNKISDVSIYDMSGKLQQHTKVNSEDADIDVSTLIKGTYLIRINDGKSEKTQKIIKK